MTPEDFPDWTFDFRWRNVTLELCMPCEPPVMFTRSECHLIARRDGWTHSFTAGSAEGAFALFVEEVIPCP